MHIELCTFLKDLLQIETARNRTLSSFLGATSALSDIESNQQEADEEEKMSMLSPARRTALALLAENSPIRSISGKGDMKEIRIESKLGANLKFVVPSDPQLSAEQWCDSVQSEVEWLVDENQFHQAFKGVDKVEREHLLKLDYKRQLVMKNGDWRVVDNSKFNICDTYPAFFAIPSSIR